MPFGSFLDDYEKDVLPPRELSKGTLALYGVHYRRFRREFSGKAMDQITIQMVAAMLDPLTPRTAKQCRALLVDIFNHAVAKGLCPDNPAASTIGRIEKKKRRRHTVEVSEGYPRILAGVAERHRPGVDHCATPHGHPEHEV